MKVTKRLLPAFLSAAFAIAAALPLTSHAQITEARIAEIVRNHAYYVPSEEALSAFSSSDLSAAARRAFLMSFDQYAHYVTADEFERTLKIGETLPAGVGMEIVCDKNGAVRTIPMADSPAIRAGIRYGDELIGVADLSHDDIRALAKSKQGFERLGEKIRGLPDTRIALTVAQSEDTVVGTASVSRTVIVTRQKADYPSVVAYEGENGMPVLRLYRFDREAAEKAGELLDTIPADKPLVIDLRGNTGGDPAAAEKLAERFLQKGKAVSRLAELRSSEFRRALKTGNQAKRTVYLWQDGLTASAAEVFLVAMRGAKNAISIGRPSAGKARVQTWFRLPNGDRIKLTTESYRFPNETGDWQTIGLKPDVPLRQGETYEAATVELDSLE